MQGKAAGQPLQLEDLPNIGRSIAADLRSIGISTPGELAVSEPLETYLRLADVMGRRHDPCVFYVLLAARHFFDSGVPLPWWKFSEEGKMLLAAEKARRK